MRTSWNGETGNTRGELQHDGGRGDPSFLQRVHFEASIVARVHQCEGINAVEGDLAERRHAVDGHCEDQIAIAQHGVVLAVLVVREEKLLEGREALGGRLAKNRAQLSLRWMPR